VAAKQIAIRQVDKAGEVVRRRQPRLQRIVECSLPRSSAATAIRDAEYWRRCNCDWLL